MTFPVRRFLAQIALAAVLAVTGCSPSESDSAKDGAKMLQVVDVAGVEKTDGGMQVTLDHDIGSVTLTDGEKGFDLGRDSLWINDAFVRRTPVAYDPEDDSIRPASIAMSVQTQDNDEGTRVMAPPRPGIMILLREHPSYERLADLLAEAAREGSGAVFALRDASVIEDVVLVPEEAAVQMLGMVPVK